MYGAVQNESLMLHVPTLNNLIWAHGRSAHRTGKFE